MEREIIKDDEGYTRQDEKMSYRDIVLRQFQKVVTNSSREMRSGFWIKSPPSPGGYTGGDKQRYIGDARLELMQSIDVLHDILQPKFDKDMKDKSKLIYKSVKRIKDWKGNNKYTQETFDKKKWELGLARYRNLFQHICYFLERQAWFVTEETEE